MKPRFFATPSGFRSWLERNHDKADELWVGFYKKGSRKPSITWPEAVDEALCFGWIDGVRKRIDDDSYANRFTPRRARSTWSAANAKRMEELIAAGRMRPAGLRAFERRAPERTGVYSYENRKAARLAPTELRQFRDSQRAWRFFQAQPAWYRSTSVWWVVSAKREETRRRRLSTLIEDSAEGRLVAPLRRGPRSG
jgi:uncharacterized protein YdeI (YjbR/CyaY-like superfamily)